MILFLIGMLIVLVVLFSILKAGSDADDWAGRE